MVKLKHDKDDLIAVKTRRRSITSNEKHHRAKNNHAYKSSGKKYSNPVNANHILVKITGGAKETKSMKAHFEYITRNDELPLFNENGDLANLKDTISDTALEINSPEIKYKKDSRKTAQIVFSRKGQTDSELLKSAVLETMQKEYPNTKFYFSCHQDTDNTHVHVVLLRHNKAGKKHEIKKAKLVNIKRSFADNLNKRGLKAEFQSETDKQKKRNNQVKNQLDRVDKRKGNDEYIVMDFGKAPYMFEDKGEPSYYISLQTKNGVIKNHWSWGIKTEIENQGIKVGDKIKLKKLRAINLEQKNNNGTFQRSTWKIELLDKGENLDIKPVLSVVDFGKAPYKFDDKGKPSYYVIVQDMQGRSKDIWGKILEKMLQENGIKVGDKVIQDFENPKNLIKTDVNQPFVIKKELNNQTGFKV